MEQQNFQTAELRDENNNIVQEGAYGRKTPLTTGDNQGWIDFVMNNLEWLKANGITVSQIATQAEAESGTDNTKVMTPLRTAQEIDKKRPGKVYRYLSELGLDSTATENDIKRAMSVGSTFTISCNASSLKLSLFEFGNYQTRITFHKMNNSEFKAVAIRNSGITFVLACSYGTDITASEWKKLATTDDIPVFSTQAQAEAGTDNTTVMTPLRVKQEMLKFPAKGFPAPDANNYMGKTIQEVRNFLDDWLNDNLQMFSCVSLRLGHDWVELWNAENLTTQITTSASAAYGIQNITPYGTANYTRLLISSYSNDRFYTATKTNGTWQKVQQLATNGALSMPSGNVINISLETYTASAQSNQTVFTYTAPSDGWIVYRHDGEANNSYTSMYMEYSDKKHLVANTRPANTPRGIGLMTPIAKGITITGKVWNAGSEASLSAYFYYAQSEV